MPLNKTHLFFGTAFTIVVYLIFRFYKDFTMLDAKFLFYLPAIIYYSVLPDLDSKHSKVREFTFLIFFLLILYSAIGFLMGNDAFYVCVLLFTLFLLVAISYLSHRHIMHSLLANIMLALPLLVISPLLAGLAAVAYFSHLFIDGELKLV